MARAMKDSGVEWIGEIPEGWSVVSLGRLFSASAGGDAKQELYSDYQDGTHPYPVYTNTLSKDQVYAYTTTPFFRSNTITVTGRGAIGHAFYRDTPYDAIIRLLSLCPKQTLNCRFYAYWIDTVIPFFTDSAAIGQLSAIQITKYKTLFLPLREQDKISEYLDIECSKINTIIEQTRASIEEYKKLKQSVITQAVTKGMRPGRKMKDSGVEWIGDIPEEWTVLRKLSYAVNKSISYGIVKLFDPDDISGVRVLRCSDVREGKIDTANIRTVAKTVSDEYSRTLLEGGEVLINVRGTLGGCAVVPPEMRGYNIAREVAMISLTDAIINRYLMYFFLSKTFGTYEERHLAGSVYVGLNIEMLAACPVTLPPLPEQEHIVDYLDNKCQVFDNVIAKKSRIIQELESYKKSLIFEYVTGKKEVC